MMRIDRSSALLAAVILVVLMVVGCSTQPSQLHALPNGAAPAPQSIHASAIIPETYIADAATNSVYIYSAAGVRTGSLTGFNEPAGLAVDGQGNLYVADEANQVVKGFAPGATTPFITLADAGFYPTSVAVDAAGNVYVSNYCSGSAGSIHCTGDGSVFKYAKGSTTHTAVFDTSMLHAPYAITFEKGKYLWADGWATHGQQGSPTVGHWSKPSTFIASAISIQFPGGMEFDTSDNLAVDDQVGLGKIPTLYIFPHGSPPASASFPLWTEAHTYGNVIAFAINASNKSIWTAVFKIELATDIMRRFTPGESQEFAYPGGGAPIKSISPGTYASGIAVAPASGL